MALETRTRIKAVCEEMGYRPSQLLSELAASRWQSDQVTQGSTIAFIDRVSNKTYVGGLDLTPALREQASILGYRLEIFRRVDFPDSTKLQRVLRNRGISEVILGPILDPAFSVELEWSKFICVQLLPGSHPRPLHSVIKDHFNSVVLAWQKAADHGYRRIGVVLLNHPLQLIDDILRRSAAEACRNHLFGHLPRLKPFFFSIDDHRAKDFIRWVKAGKPEVIIGFSAAHHYVFRSQFQRDIPYISLGEKVGSEISGIYEAASSCAREAVNLLHFCRRTYQWGIPRERIDHVVEPVWFEGTTLPYKNASPNEAARASRTLSTAKG